MDRPTCRSLYSATLCMGATPLFDCNSVYAVPAGQRAPGTVRCPGTLGFSITPHLISCFFKEAPCRKRFALFPNAMCPIYIDERPTAVANTRSDASVKKQPLHPQWGKNPSLGSQNPRCFLFLTMSNSVLYYI
jgi:hypothetical protein